ncbi:hypothetical protein D3C72_1547860 [compost metagenome]
MLRMKPADQRLGTGEGTVGQPNLRLIEEHEFAVADCPLQLEAVEPPRDRFMP